MFFSSGNFALRSLLNVKEKQVGWGADAPFTGSSVTLPQNQDLHLSAHPARHLRISWHVLDQGAFLCGVDGDSFDRGRVSFCCEWPSSVATELFLWRHLSASVCDGPRKVLAWFRSIHIVPWSTV